MSPFDPWNVLMPVAAVFAFGAAVIALFGARAGAAGLWRYYGSTARIVAAFLLPAALHPLLFALAAALLAWRCMTELALTYGLRPVQPLLAVAALAAAGLGRAPPALLAALTLAALAFYLPALRAAPRGFAAWGTALLFPLLAAAALIHLMGRENGFAWVFLVYATAETQDSMAFLFGRLFGRRQALPRLSPGKTLVGVVAGLLCGGLLAAALAHILLGFSAPRAAALAAFVTLAALAGDLFTSRLKRVAGVKDFPPVSALHGGALDVYDSTLFAALALALAGLAWS
ncbi:MAG: phosphatidate cytidylyltransferase [Betaproteobacteria bacterium]|nr:phosphatidate cytidylyltransferase [Betaproteobacteria bacterium]